MELYQVRILTDNFERAFRFYSESLGLHLAWGDVGGPYAAFSLDGQANIAIFQRVGMAEAATTLAAPPGDRTAGSPMIVLQVEDVDQLYTELRDKGLLFATSPRDYPDWTIRAVHLHDPDGTLIELFEPLPEDEWTSWARTKNAQAPRDSSRLH